VRFSIEVGLDLLYDVTMKINRHQWVLLIFLIFNSNITVIACPAPDMPNNPSPFNVSVNRGFSAMTLQWNNGVAGPGVRYDIYLDTNNPPTQLYCSDISEVTCEAINLTPCATYYWRVVAKKNCYGEVSGPIWSFQTGDLGDINLDNLVNLIDYSLLAARMYSGQCFDDAYCDGTDLNQSGNVDVLDLIKLSQSWLSSCSQEFEFTRIYWANASTRAIQRANIDGSNAEVLIISMGLNFPSGMALDHISDKIYWSDRVTHKIQRSNLDGTNIEDIITTEIVDVGNIALDLIHGKIYWSDYDTQKIQCSNLDGSNIQDVIASGLNTPDTIAIDPIGGKLYWVDSGADKIQRSNLNGSGLENLITSGLFGPRGIALDTLNGKMYWINTGIQTIQKANLDGTNIENILYNESTSMGYLALDIPAGTMYWAINLWGNFQKANLDGSNLQTIVTGSDVRAIALGNF